MNARCSALDLVGKGRGGGGLNRWMEHNLIRQDRRMGGWEAGEEVKEEVVSQ